MDINDLIQAAQSEDEPKKEKKRSPNKFVLKFIKAFQIKSGEIRVPVYKIVYEFYKWESVNRVDKCSAIEIGRTFSQFFDQKRTGKYRYYLLNECFDMSKDEMKKAKEYYKKWQLSYRRNKRDKEKEKQKIKDEISSS